MSLIRVVMSRICYVMSGIRTFMSGTQYWLAFSFNKLFIQPNLTKIQTFQSFFHKKKIISQLYAVVHLGTSCAYEPGTVIYEPDSTSYEPNLLCYERHSNIYERHPILAGFFIQ
ncbi:hypothetical protein [Bacillus suaedae]|uniref:Uncharacterized protein n=1 Tax=Halalkalibacter suaedae TaxID=2822140 RepID=A0A940WR12_9BACI|nr:hypothetical protein [Bacillus suaedae]MBP3950228.1 hypothetical protein [Bacillus suaedae]